jgi:hypothetical protein
MKLAKYSMGIGDRFACQGKAQLKAFLKAKDAGVDVVPVWNKSHREHSIIHTEPQSVRREADEAVKAMGWKDAYYVDADHIGLKNVDLFLEASDFFTLDVAESIGREPDDKDLQRFVDMHMKYAGSQGVPGVGEDLQVTGDMIEAIGRRYLGAVKEAGRIYRHIEAAKGKDNFVTEVSMDETAAPQTPVEMFFILAAIADEGIPAQTIAPRFSGRFNKGVDYVGDTALFTREFESDLAAIRFAVEEFSLPSNLKLSVHSGSDKFSIYGPMAKVMRRFDAGLHLKTAGTTWLEECIGLASAGGEGLKIAREAYGIALERFDELCGPYAEVIDIRKDELPSPETVNGWDSSTFTSALRHDQSSPQYNPNLRQLLHVGYKVAAEMGERYLDALKAHEDTVAENVTENIFERHLKPIFIDN